MHHFGFSKENNEKLKFLCYKSVKKKSLTGEAMTSGVSNQRLACHIRFIFFIIYLFLRQHGVGHVFPRERLLLCYFIPDHNIM